MKSKKILSLLAVAALATTVFVGCGSKDEAAFKDGSYEAKVDTFDDNGYAGKINIDVKDGKITTVKYDEVNAEGTGKVDNKEYNAKMVEFGAKSTPAEAFPKLEAALVEKQDVDAVDAVTGVTTSSESFKKLAAEALKDAK